MPHVRTPLPAELPRPVFTIAEAQAHGVSPARLRSRDIQPLRRGLFALADEPHTDLHVLQALRRTLPDAVVIGPTAAALYGFPLPHDQKSRQLHLAVPPSRRLRSNALVKWHRRSFAPGELRQARELSITTRVGTWVDLAAYLDVTGLVVAGDHLVRFPRPQFEDRWVPYATFEQLEAAVQCSKRGV